MRLAIVALAFLVASSPSPGGTMSLDLNTTAFQHQKEIPEKFTCKGADLSPELVWTGTPDGTKTFALIVDDPDAPAGAWVHWVAFNIPVSVTQFHEGMPKDAELKDGTRQGKNDFGKLGYNGPCPPPGGYHRYYFRLYALDAVLDLKPGATRQDLDRAMAHKVIGKAELMGKFKR
jgi:Raf kinase inhibitor-like YbhB/YbcL family protein